MPTVDLNTGMEVIEPGECWALLATEEVGRIVVVLANQAEIFPVNYVVDEGTVMFRTDPGTKLAGSMSGPVVLEVDHVDPETRTAWSVIIRGRAHQVTSEDLALQRRISSLALSIWLPTTKQHLIRITPTTVTGRRIQGHRQSATSEPSPTTRRQAMNAELTELVHRLERLGLRPWAPGDKPHWIRLRTPVVTGRCITPPDSSARNSDPRPA